MNVPNKVILHCTDTPDRGDLVGVSEIRQWHLEKRWKDVGYHFCIRRSGLIEPGRPVHQIGAHTKGENKNSLGIALVGNRDFTADQVSSLKVLYRRIKNDHQIDYDKWFCHYEFSSKTCPNIPVHFLRELLRLS